MPGKPPDGEAPAATFSARPFPWPPPTTPTHQTNVNMSNNIELTRFGQLPAVRLRTPEGAQAVVTLYGAHLVSWQTADGRERLFCSSRSALDGSKAIRGGVPLIFPQFAEQGKGVRHGFARLCDWTLEDPALEADGCAADFTISSAGQYAAQWPHPFRLTLRVSLHANTLELRLAVRNDAHGMIGSEGADFSFACALHTYFLVDDLARATLHGLQHVRYSDNSNGPTQPGRQEEAMLRLSGKLDRIYHCGDSRDGQDDRNSGNGGGGLTLDCGAGRLLLEQEGFSANVVWNPGPADAAAMSDMAPEEWRRFLCVEAAQIDRLTLAPGAEWVGTHRVVALD